MLQTLSTAAELRRPVYRAVALRSVNVDSCLQQMMTVKWDIKDIMSQHSGYVDSLLHVSLLCLLLLFVSIMFCSFRLCSIFTVLIQPSAATFQ